jgi:hypothetical protein
MPMECKRRPEGAPLEHEEEPMKANLFRLACGVTSLVGLAQLLGAPRKW